MRKPETTRWPTLGNKVKSWDGQCDRCGEPYPADTRVSAAWSPTLFYISCHCSPRELVAMECKP